MSKLNQTVNATVDEISSHRNFMGGDSWTTKDVFFKLLLAGSSCFFGEPKYYDQKTGNAIDNTGYCYSIINDHQFRYLQSMLGTLIYSPCPCNQDSHPIHVQIEQLIDQCLDIDVEKTLKIGVYLRNVFNIRTTPQVIVVRAAMHKNSKGTGLVNKYIDQICIRGDEPAEQLAYLYSRFGTNTPIPNQLKKGWKRILESFNDYVISKYRMENNIVKTRDVVNLVHAYSDSINKLMNGNAKQENTWNNIVSNANKEEKSQKEIWTDALRGMPHMALLRNLRNLHEAGVDFNMYNQKLIDGVDGGKQLPFRYYSAYKALNESGVNDPKIYDLVETCLERSFKNAPHFPGKVVCLSDNSGSAWDTLTSELGTMKVAEIGNMMAVATAKMGDEGYVGAFGDKLHMFPIRKTDSMLTQTEKLTNLGKKVGKSTENGIWLFFNQAINNKEHYDHIFVYSDMQCGHGGLYGLNPQEYNDYQWQYNHKHIDVAKLINKYRTEVNSNAMVYLIQTAGYQDFLVPECFDKTFIFGGWSANIPVFAAEMYKLFN